MHIMRGCWRWQIDRAVEKKQMKEGFHVTGHNYEYKDDGKSAFYDLVKREDIESKLRKYYEENGLHLMTIQGELCAPGIQQNRLKLTRPEWYVFTIFL